MGLAEKLAASIEGIQPVSESRPRITSMAIQKLGMDWPVTVKTRTS